MCNRKTLAVLSFLIPVGLWCAVLILCRIIPFGDATLLIWDANTQYIDFLSWWRRVLTGKENLWYTFSKTLGGGTIGLLSYYTASPFNWLLILFEESQLPIAFTLLVVLKAGLCGMTFQHYLESTWHSGATALLFSTSYALMGYVSAYCWDVMWMDGVLLLPLILLGLRRLASGGRPALYVISLGTAILSNFYIGYMVCVFCALYYLMLLCTGQTQGKRSLIPFAGASMLAAGLSAVILIPTLISLLSNYGMSSPMEWKTNFSLWKLGTKLFTGSASYEQLRDGMPNLYVGLIPLVPALHFFFSFSISLRKRASYATLFVILVLSFWLSVLNLFWHGFDVTNFFPFRYSFVFSFLLLECAFLGLRRAEKPSYGCIILFALYALVIFWRCDDAAFQPVSLFTDTAVFAAAWLILRFFAHKGRNTLLLLTGLQLFCLISNSVQTIHSIQWVNTSPASSYSAAVSQTQDMLEAIRILDPDAGCTSRIEKTYFRTANDALQHGYAGLSHFSSDENKGVIDFMGRLGFRNAAGYAHYNRGTTAVCDALFGVKYLISPSDPSAGAYNRVLDQVYENPNALKWAYLIVQNSPTLPSGNPFEVQNHLFYAVTGESSVFKPVTVKSNGNGIFYIPAQAGERLYLYGGGQPLTGTASLNGVPLSLEQLDALADCYLLPVSDQTCTHELSVQFDTEMLPIVYSLDELRFQAGIQHIQTQDIHLKRTGNRIDISVSTAQDGCLLLTFPQEDGWQMRLDGQKVQPQTSFSVLMSLPVPSGEHQLSMVYYPKGLKTGVLATLLSLISVTAWQCVCKRRMKI